MPLFKYQAVNTLGKKIDGLIEADSLDHAKDSLRKQKILITKIFFHKTQKHVYNLPANVLISFTRDLSGLLKSSLPLYESLLAIEEKHRGAKYHVLFLKLCEDVKLGKRLSASMRNYPKAFDNVYVAMIESGEETGNLTEVFGQLFGLLSKTEKLKKQIITALIYPSFLLAFCCIVVFSLFYFLIPSMKDLFQDRQLHPLTQRILHLSEMINENALWIFLFLFSLLGSIIVFSKSHQGRKWIKKSILFLPLLKTMMTEAVLIRFSRVLSALLRNGVSMSQALPLARRAMNHPSFEEIIVKTEEKLIEGQPISSELKKSVIIPKLMIRMLAISEEAGDISPMLQHIAELYEESLERNIARVTTLLQPAMLLILGIIVGTILIAVLLPLTDVSSFIN